MKSAKIKDADLERRHFRGANLENADLSQCDITGISLRGAMLNGAAINLSEVAKENLEGALTTQSSGLTIKDLPRPIEELLRMHQHWVESGGKKGRRLISVSSICARASISTARA